MSLQYTSQKRISWARNSGYFECSTHLVPTCYCEFSRSGISGDDRIKKKSCVCNHSQSGGWRRLVGTSHRSAGFLPSKDGQYSDGRWRHQRGRPAGGAAGQA